MNNPLGNLISDIHDLCPGQSNRGFKSIIVLYFSLFRDGIQSELEGVKKHDDGLKIFERHGIRSYSQALALQGYKVKWSGLDPDNAEIPKE